MGNRTFEPLSPAYSPFEKSEGLPRFDWTEGDEASLFNEGNCFRHISARNILRDPPEESKTALQEVFKKYVMVACKATDSFRISILEKLVGELRARVSALEERRTVLVPVETFAPEPFSIVRPIQVVVEQFDDAFVATYFDANVNASGDTEVEAVENLKEVMLLTFDSLENEKSLGAALARKVAVLKSIIKRA